MNTEADVVAAHFATPLEARWLDAKRREILRSLVFYSAHMDRVFVVPVGFITDLASVPRLPVIYWLFGGVADEAAALHDYLYTGIISRKDADEVFAEACKATGKNALTRGPMWAAVRVAGGLHYTNKSK